jgi:hypothetical protein
MFIMEPVMFVLERHVRVRVIFLKFIFVFFCFLIQSTHLKTTASEWGSVFQTRKLAETLYTKYPYI